MLPFGIQPLHLVIIAVVALLIFGPSRLPEIGRGIGKALKEFQRGTKEMSEGFKEEVSKPVDPNAAPVQPPVAASQTIPQPLPQPYIQPIPQTIPQQMEPAAVNRMQVERLTDLGAGFEPGEARDRLVAQFNRAAEANSAAGAEVVIAAGGVVMALLAHADIHEAAGMPILNGITNLVKLGEMAVKTNRLMGGRFTSKRCVYAPPPPDQIAEFRKHYGADIYPTVRQS